VSSGGSTEDAWLTVAEIADELRVNPATVRLWISKDLLPAKRAGRRKLLIRRSDLEQMLRAQERDDTEQTASEPASRGVDRRQPLASVSRIWPDPPASPRKPAWMEEASRVFGVMRNADAGWGAAQHASEFAPPDANFPHRLHALAAAAAGQSRAFAEGGANPRFRWPATDSWQEIEISHELRPGGNRPGPPPMWAEFDRRVQRLGISMSTPDFLAIASAWQDLADIMEELSEAILDELPEAGQGA
jgi:excisionase family DNA binding protein